MRIIVGLGNPGKQYERTRHNAGFRAVDALAKELGLEWKNNKKLKADLAKGNDIILIKPMDFMNNSGFSVAAVLNYYLRRPLDKEPVPSKPREGWGDLLANSLTVIHDDLDIELGKYKISVDSRSAGHRGVESIINRLKTKNFKRVRLGIKTPALEKIPADKYVLQKFSSEEEKNIKQLISKIIPEIKKRGL